MNSSTNATKRWWYIMPIVFITYSLAYLDRANFSFASAAGITEDLGITKGISSLLGALFFLGYFFFQIPGAIYAERRSVRKLIFICLILWGGCASLTGIVHNIPALAAIRFILGVVEAAVMPAMLIYISNWFTKSSSRLVFSSMVSKSSLMSSETEREASTFSSGLFISVSGVRISCATFVKKSIFAAYNSRSFSRSNLSIAC